MRYLTKILILTACLIALSGVAAACYNEPLTQGYWKNHPDANAWDYTCLGIDKLTIGNTDYDGQSELLCLLKQPTNGDARIILAHQLIAARLNVANNAWYETCNLDYTLVNLIEDAEDWLESQKDEVSPSSLEGQKAIAWAKTLDQFNNGEPYNL